MKKSLYRGVCLLGGLSLLCSAVGPILLHAQTGSAQAGTSAVETPKIFVTNLSLDRKELEAGQTLTGHFELLNQGNAPSSDIYYNIVLVGKFVNRVPQEVYDTVRRGPLSLASGEKQTVNFSYVVPEGFASDDMGVRIQAIMKSGIRMGWADEHISVLGTSTLLLSNSPAIAIGDKEYPPTSGPTVAANANALYRLSLVNNTKKEAVIYPKIQVYRYGDAEKIAYSSTGVEMKIAANSAKTVDVSLPEMDRFPGVYFGTLTFVDGAGNPKSSILNFRYIIDGDIVTIQGVSVDKVRVKNGDTIDASVTFTGAPFDISSGMKKEMGTVDLMLIAYNEKGQEVGRTEKTVDASASVQTAHVLIPVNAEAASLKIAATASKSGSVLSAYSTNSFEKTKIASVVNSADYVFARNVGIASIVFLIIIFVVIVVAAKGRGKKRLPHYPSGLGMLVLGMTVLSAISLSRLETSKAFVYETSLPANFRPLFINLPYDNQQFLPNQSFYLEGIGIFQECDNASYGPRQIHVVYNGTVSDFSIGQAYVSAASTSPYSVSTDVSDAFSLGPFTAPSTPGTHRMNITYTLISPGNPDYTESGYVDTVVSGSAPQGNGPVVLSQSLTAAPCGGYSSLSWTPLLGATRYQLYRDGLRIYNGTGLSYVDNVPAGTYHSYYILPSIGVAEQPVSNTLNLQATNYCPLNAYYIAPNPSPAVVDQDVTWAVWVTGGSGVYDYVWTGTEGLNDTSGRVVHKQYTYTGPKTVTVTVHSSDGQTANTTGNLTVWSWNGYDSIQCFASPIKAIVGKPVTWTVNLNPSDPGYSYVWTGSDGLYSASNTPTIVKTYDTLGLKHAQVDVVGLGTFPDCLAEVEVKWKSLFEEQ